MRFYNGYVYRAKDGAEKVIEEIREDFDDVEAGPRQIAAWLNDEGTETVDGCVIYRFLPELREEVNANRAVNDAEYMISASQAILRENWRKDEEDCERRRLAAGVELYQSFTHDEWINGKNALQRLIAIEGGEQLNPASETGKALYAMYGVLAVAAWNAARWSNGFSIPSAKEISAEADRILKKWRERGTIV